MRGFPAFLASAGLLLLASLPASALPTGVGPRKGPVPGIRRIVSLQLDGFLRLPPLEGLSGLKRIAESPVAEVRVEERAAAGALLSLLASPLPSEAKPRLIETLGPRTLETVETLSRHIQDFGGSDLQELLSRLQGEFGPERLDLLFDGGKTKDAGPVPAPKSPAWTRALRRARRATAAEVARLLALRSQGAEVLNVLASKDTKTITEYSGVPRRIEELPDDGRVHRHWVRRAEDLEALLASGLLKAGPVSYVDFTGSSAAYIKDIYVDLRGVFFTSPRRSSEEPRVMNEAAAHWVDFRLPNGVKALSLDGDTVMMVPAEPGALIPIKVVASSAERSLNPTAP